MSPQGPATQLKATTITVSRTVARPIGTAATPGGARESEQSSDLPQTIQVHQFATTPAMVSVEVPLKKGAGYSSAGVTLRVDKPCYAEEIPQAIDEVFEIVNRRVAQEWPELLKLAARLSASEAK